LFVRFNPQRAKQTIQTQEETIVAANAAGFMK